MQLRDKFWLWGHPEGRYNNEHGNTRVSRMTPMEGCLYLGVKNTFLVPDGWEMNRRQYNKSVKTLNQVGWECFKAIKDPSVVEPLIQEAADFPNIGCVVFDDFMGYRSVVAEHVKNGGDPDMGVKNLWAVQHRLKNNDVRPLDMWMVLYTKDFGIVPEKDEDLIRHIEPFDGIIMWTWEEKDVPLIPEKWELFKKMTPNNKRMFGCYLWNFGEKKEATGAAVKWQLDWYLEKIRAGEAEGVVLHTNTMADLDLEAYDVACEWMEKHGDEIIY